jgi:hypothetical protein
MKGERVEGERRGLGYRVRLVAVEACGSPAVARLAAWAIGMGRRLGIRDGVAKKVFSRPAGGETGTMSE